MCPLCIGTAWLIAGGVSSAGGAATVAWRSVARRRRKEGSRKPATAAGKQAKPQRLQIPRTDSV